MKYGHFAQLSFKSHLKEKVYPSHMQKEFFQLNLSSLSKTQKHL